MIHIFILHNAGAVAVQKPRVKGNRQIAAVRRLQPPSGMEYVRIAEHALSCFQVIQTVIHLIGNPPLHNKGQFNLRMPMPGKLSGIKIRQSFIAYQHRKLIASMAFDLFLFLIDLKLHIISISFYFIQIFLLNLYVILIILILT